MVEKGLTYSVSTLVDASKTAKAMGSGDIEVLATPAMVALMENAAMEAVSAVLPESSATVGTSINVLHARATPLGEIVTAEARLIEVEGRKLVFEVTASDTKGEIGSGTHERFIVDRERFLSKL